MAGNTIIIRDEDARRLVVHTICDLSPSKAWEVTIKPHVARRTTSQNNLMWAWFAEVAHAVGEHTGTDKDDIKKYCAEKFLKPRIVEIEGDILEVYETKKLTTAEMSAFMQRVYIWATSELGLLLPLPSELGRDETGRAT